MSPIKKRAVGNLFRQEIGVVRRKPGCAEEIPASLHVFQDGLDTVQFFLHGIDRLFQRGNSLL